MTPPKITEAQAEELTAELPLPCLSALSMADEYNVLRAFDRLRRDKARLEAEIARLRQDKADLRKALKETISELTVSNTIIRRISTDKYSAQITANVNAWTNGIAALAEVKQ